MRFGPLPPSFNNTYSLAFDGVDDFVNSGASTLSGETALSISAWVYPTSYGDATAPSFVSTDAASPRAFYLGLFNGTNFRFSLSTNGTALTSLDTAAGTVDLNVWQHILVTWDQVNLKLYKNGVLLKTVATTFASNGTFTTTNDLLIGARRSSAGFFEGNIDEVAVFNSVVDIADVWDGTGEATDLSSISGLTNWYRNGDNGTFKSPQWLIPNNENKTKFSNYSFEYDGVDDFVNISNPIPLGLTSISFWMKSTHSGNDSITSGLGNLSFIGTTPLVRLSGLNYRYFADQASKFDGEWHHWFLLIAGSGQSDITNSRLFVDGVEISSGITVNSVPPSSWTNSEIGRGFYGSINASIDEFAIWQSDETANISTIYNSGVPTDISSLSPVGYWRSEQSNFTDNWLVDNSALSNYSTRSFAFDGIDDYIPVNGSIISSAGDMTISSWANFSSLAGVQGIFDSANFYRSGFNGGFSFRTIGTNLDVAFSNGTVFSSYSASTGLSTSGGWYHLAFTFNNTTKLGTFYLNGVAFDTYTFTGFDNADLVNGGVIGRAVRINSYCFTGFLDEISIFNSIVDVATLYNSGEPARIEGAVAHWRMGEDATFNTNWNVPDQVGSATGTSANMTIADLEGDAPNYTGGGLSNNMTIEDRVGDAPNSTSNALSYNMDEADRETDVPS